MEEKEEKKPTLRACRTGPEAKNVPTPLHIVTYLVNLKNHCDGQMSFCPSVLGTQWSVTIAHSLGYIERKNKRKKEPPIDKLNIES